MGVAAHLGIDLREYDARIRTFIPNYEELLSAAAATVAALAPGRSPRVLDLGIGTGGLASRVLAAIPRARITGVDADPAVLDVAERRLRRRLQPLRADFSERRWTRFIVSRRFDAITASLSLHHVRTKRRKTELYRECFRALGPPGVLVSADCCVAASSAIRRSDRLFWRAHLERTYSTKKAERFLRAWSREDVYFTLDEELEMMRRAGFSADVVWRQHSFAVIAATRNINS